MAHPWIVLLGPVDARLPALVLALRAVGPCTLVLGCDPQDSAQLGDLLACAPDLVVGTDEVVDLLADRWQEIGAVIDLGPHGGDSAVEAFAALRVHARVFDACVRWQRRWYLALDEASSTTGPLVQAGQLLAQHALASLARGERPAHAALVRCQSAEHGDIAAALVYCLTNGADVGVDTTMDQILSNMREGQSSGSRRAPKRRSDA